MRPFRLRGKNVLPAFFPLALAEEAMRERREIPAPLERIRTQG